MEVVSYYRFSEFMSEIRRVARKETVYTSFMVRCSKDQGIPEFCITSVAFYKGNKRHQFCSTESLPKMPDIPKENLELNAEAEKIWREKCENVRVEIEKLQAYMSIRFQVMEQELSQIGCRVIQGKAGQEINGIFDSLSDLPVKTREQLKKLAEAGKEKVAALAEKKEVEESYPAKGVKEPDKKEVEESYPAKGVKEPDKKEVEESYPAKEASTYKKRGAMGGR